MKEQKTTKWSNFNPLCLARHVLRNLWMTVLAGLICVMAVYLLQTLVSKPSYDSQVTFAVTSRSASATASGSIAVTDSVASQFGELLQSNPVRTAAAAEMGLNAFPGTCSVDVPENTNILILTVTAPTPELAFRGALAVMDCYEAYADFILASAVLNPINGPTLPSQPSAQASRDRLLRLAGPIGALAMIAVLLLLAVSQETVQTVPGARDQLDTKLLATLRHERKRGALLLSYGLSFILNIILFFLSPENASSTLVLALLFGTGIFNGFCTALLYGMIGDTVEYGQWKTGVRADGLCSSGTSFMLKLGGAIAPTMLLAMLAANGYAEGAATQTAGALSTMNVVMNLVPAILAAISFILFVSYKLDNKLHAQIIQDLKDRGQYVVEE